MGVTYAYSHTLINVPLFPPSDAIIGDDKDGPTAGLRLCCRVLEHHTVGVGSGTSCPST